MIAFMYKKITFKKLFLSPIWAKERLNEAITLKNYHLYNSEPKMYS